MGTPEKKRGLRSVAEAVLVRDTPRPKRGERGSMRGFRPLEEVCELQHAPGKTHYKVASALFAAQR